jgi:hypothetical protein
MTEDEHEFQTSSLNPRGPSNTETSYESIVLESPREFMTQEEAIKSQPQLSTVQDQHLNTKFNSSEKLTCSEHLLVPTLLTEVRSWASSPPGPVGAVKRLATLRVAKSWAGDRTLGSCVRNVTPPLRTSSANSIGRLRMDGGLDGISPSMVVPEKVVPIALVGEKENLELSGLDIRREVGKVDENETKNESEKAIHGYRGIRWTKAKGKGLHRVDLSGGLRSFFR